MKRLRVLLILIQCKTESTFSFMHIHIFIIIPCEIHINQVMTLLYFITCTHHVDIYVCMYNLSAHKTTKTK